MSRIVDVLMRRDGLTKKEAVARVQEVREMVYEAVESGMFDEAEDIVMSELGLEMDYIDELIM